MKGLLVVSAAPGATPPTGEAVRAAVGHLSTGNAEVHRCPDGWVGFAGPEPSDRRTAGGGFTVRLTRSVRGRAGDATPAELARLLGDGTAVDGKALAELLPPFAAAHRSGPTTPVVLAGDWLGLRQLFWWAGDRVAAVSTSALALGALAGAELNPAALGVQSLLGWQVGLDTVVTGVTKLAPGSVAVLQAGRVEVRRYAEPSLADADSGRPLPAVVDELADILRDLVTGYLTDHPDTVLQLSGGQDSRMLLCAVPPELRPGLPAFTLDIHGGAESRVAAALSRQCGLAHQVLWLDGRPPVDDRTGYLAAREAAWSLDAMASPLALGALDLIERDLPQGRRLSGIGGETARGYYYPGQPRSRGTSAGLVERLANWRLFTNEAVEQEALDRDFAVTARRAALSAVTECFEQLSPDWLRATDEFYLWQRTQRWAGAHGTSASVARHLVNPLLDRRFCQLVLALPPEHKRRSRLTGLLIRRLDPRLAEVALDSGLVPARLARPGLRSRAAFAGVSGRKTVSKVWQRVRGHRRPQLGAADLSKRVIAHWRAVPELVAPVRRSGIVRDRWLDRLLDGQLTASPATVSFLVNLSVVTEAARVQESAAAAGPASTPRG